MPKLFTIIFVSAIAVLLGACNDNCRETRVSRRFTSVNISQEELRQSIKLEGPRKLDLPGKIYTKGDFLFINELKEGIHILDNSNPSAPRFVSFIRIPGNGDMAARGDVLYADSYSDLVAFDISDPVSPRVLNRVNDVFVTGTFEGASWWLQPNTGNIVDQNVSFVEEEFNTNCEEALPWFGWGGWGFVMNAMAFSTLSSGNRNLASDASGGGGDGTAGSMARFALYDKYLYTIGSSELQLFDISTPQSPVHFSKVNVGWGIETIFPYQDKLFIGSNTGMFIYDNADPASPKRLSEFTHRTACDPVVVSGNYAYVTLRSGTFCTPTQVDQLDVIDISSLTSPKLIKSYRMQNPHGLSIDGNTLYLCEGKFGLKGFDVTNKNEVDKNQLFHHKGFDAFDVIALQKTLLVIGKDGFYQYDRSNAKDPKLLSRIPVEERKINVVKIN